MSINSLKDLDMNNITVFFQTSNACTAYFPVCVFPSPLGINSSVPSGIKIIQGTAGLEDSLSQKPAEMDHCYF